MDLFDLPPKENADLAGLANQTAKRLAALRQQLCGYTRPAPPRITNALDGAIEEFKAAGESGRGLGCLHLDDARALERVILGLCREREKTEANDRAQAAYLEHQRQVKIAKLRKEGNLVKPFHTIWQIPYFANLSEDDQELTLLEWVCEKDARVIHVLIRTCNELRTDLMGQGVFDTSMIRPHHQSFGIITGSILRYARDMWAEDHNCKKGNSQYRKNRIAFFNRMFDKKPLSYNDFKHC